MAPSPTKIPSKLRPLAEDPKHQRHAEEHEIGERAGNAGDHPGAIIAAKDHFDCDVGGDPGNDDPGEIGKP